MEQDLEGSDIDVDKEILEAAIFSEQPIHRRKHVPHLLDSYSDSNQEEEDTQIKNLRSSAHCMCIYHTRCLFYKMSQPLLKILNRH